MKGSKYLLLLATLMVGFGLVGVADAATVKSISVTSPDSGAIKGIDSTFVVTAKILDLSPVDSLEVIMYLTTSSDSIVVADTLNNAVTWGGRNQMTVINIARDRAILATLLYHALRRDELCKLKTSDVIQTRGNWYFRVWGLTIIGTGSYVKSRQMLGNFFEINASK